MVYRILSATLYNLFKKQHLRKPVMKTLGNMSGGNKLTSFRYTKKNISVIGKSKFCIHITLENKHNPSHWPSARYPQKERRIPSVVVQSYYCSMFILSHLLFMFFPHLAQRRVFFRFFLNFHIYNITHVQFPIVSFSPPIIFPQD